ncbi:MAG: sigma-70 family RNA polymerase sigma factor [Myxococcota bacterium]
MIERDQLLRVLGDALRSAVPLERPTAPDALPPEYMAELQQVAADAVRLRSDRQLIKRAAGGDRRALDELVERLVPGIRRRVRRRLREHGRPAEAHGLEKDLVQECLIRLFSRRANLLQQWRPEKGATLDSWCGYATDSVVLGHLRSGRKSGWREVLEDPPEIGRELPVQPRLEAQTLDRAFLTQLMGRLREVLSPTKLNLFWALYVEERDPDELAQELGKSRDAIYTAKARLIQQIQREAQHLAEAKRDE